MNEPNQKFRQAWDGFGGDSNYDRPPPPPQIKRSREGVFRRVEPDGAEQSIGESFAAVILHTRLERSGERIDAG